MEITAIIEKWYDQNKRDLPWRGSNSPYHIWLSEIIMQQTRIDQGISYYHKFVSWYPLIEDLAEAAVDDVLKLWQGLGYYTRARNMHATAGIIAQKFHGHFPEDYEALIKLKGIGPYTAAAIASIAFKKPVALVDGNVFRVLARLFAIRLASGSPEARTVFNKLALDLLNPARPDIHNQAMMEFGALVCLPRNPKCNECVLTGNCKAYILGMVNLLPVRKEKKVIPTRYFHYLFVRHFGKTFLIKRHKKDIWHSLYEFPLIETPAPSDVEELIKKPPWNLFPGIRLIGPHNGLKTYRHKLTHQTLICCFYSAETKAGLDFQPAGYVAVELELVSDYAVPRVIDRYIKDMEKDGLLKMD